MIETWLKIIKEVDLDINTSLSFHEDESCTKLKSVLETVRIAKSFESPQVWSCKLSLSSLVDPGRAQPSETELQSSCHCSPVWHFRIWQTWCRLGGLVPPVAPQATTHRWEKFLVWDQASLACLWPGPWQGYQSAKPHAVRLTVAQTSTYASLYNWQPLSYVATLRLSPLATRPSQLHRHVCTTSYNMHHN